MPERISLTELRAKALETAQRFADYGSYRGLESRAVAALHRRSPGWEKQDCRSWFDKALAVHRSGIAYMQIHADEAQDIWRNAHGIVDLSPIAGGFFERFPEFSNEQLELALFRILDWYHLR